MKNLVIFAPEVCVKVHAYLIHTRNSHRIQYDKPKQSGYLKTNPQITVKGRYKIPQTSLTFCQTSVLSDYSFGADEK